MLYESKVKMSQISLIPNKTSDSLQPISFVILALHPYLEDDIFFCSPDFLTAVCSQPLWFNLLWEGSYVIYFSSFLGFQGWWKSRSVWCLVAAAVRGICRQKVPCVAPLLWVHWGTSPSYYTAEHLVLCLHLINQTASSLWGRWILNDEKRLLIILCNS